MTTTLLPAREHSFTTPPSSQGAQPAHSILFHHRPSHSPTQHFLHSSQSPRTSCSPASPGLGTNASVAAQPELFPLNRQLRPPKSPLYIPAALRPTDRPGRYQPLTPPHSIHGSTDSLFKATRVTTNSSFQSNNTAHQRNSSSVSTRPLSRRSTATSLFSSPSNGDPYGCLLEHIPADELAAASSYTADLPAVTGPPTREGWKPDANAGICDHLICQKGFGLFERRHHCRHCGDVFCNEHSTDRVPLDQNADFHPSGQIERACAFCAGQWVTWMEDRVRKVKAGELGLKGTRTTGSGTEGKDAEDGEAADVARPMVAVSRKTPEDSLRMSLLAGSVNNDWSTF